jgi:hypothetical protein
MATQQEEVLSQLMASLQQPPEPMVGPPPIGKGQRLAMALAGTLNPEFRKSFVEPRLAAEAGAPAAEQEFRRAQETQKLQKGLLLMDLLGKQEEAAATAKQKQTEEIRKGHEADSKIELNKAHAAYYRAVAKRGPGGKANPLFTALDKQVSALQKYSDALTKSYDISGEEIPAEVRAKKAQVQKQIEGLLKRQEAVLRKVLPDLIGSEDPFQDNPPEEEDFFGEAPETGGI